MDKRELTVEELEVQYNDVAKQYKDLGNLIKQKKKEEAERKQAELALEKERRTKEVKEARKHARDLLAAYIKDYGSYEEYDDGMSVNRAYSKIFEFFQ